MAHAKPRYKANPKSPCKPHGKPCYLIMAALFLALGLISNMALATCNPAISLKKPGSIYQDNLNGTVTDTETGLMWQKCSLGQSWNAGTGACDDAASAATWQAALDTAQVANGTSDYGFNDWRLPNLKELRSLAEMACYSPAINSNLFPSTASDHYWSASPSNRYSNDAWNISFIWGLTFNNDKSDSLYVRLVRTSQ